MIHMIDWWSLLIFHRKVGPLFALESFFRDWNIYRENIFPISVSGRKIKTASDMDLKSPIANQTWILCGVELDAQASAMPLKKPRRYGPMAGDDCRPEVVLASIQEEGGEVQQSGERLWERLKGTVDLLYNWNVAEYFAVVSKQWLRYRECV